MKAKTIYVVSGCAGSYEDRRTWDMAAFTTLKKANKFAAVCREAASVFYAEWLEGSNPVNKVDSDLQNYESGEVKYVVFTLELR